MSLVINHRKPKAPASRWEDYAPGIRIKVRTLDDERYAVANGRINRMIQRRDAEAGGQVIAFEGEEPVYDQQCAAVGAYLVEDWEGVEEIAADAPEGTEPHAVNYTTARATALLKGNPSFFTWVLSKASAIAAESAKEAQDTKGKPSSASSGKSPKPGKADEGKVEPSKPGQSPSETRSPTT